MSEELALATAREEALEKEWTEIQAKAQKLLEDRDAASRKKRALAHCVASHPPEIQEQQAPAKRRRGQPLSTQIKSLIVEKVHTNGELSWDEAVVAYGVSRSTIQRVVAMARVQETHQQAIALGEPIVPPLPTIKKRGRKPALSGGDLVEILDWIEENSILTLKQIVSRIDSELKKKVTKSTVERALEALNISYKDVVEIPEKWNTPEVLAARQRFVHTQVRDFVGRPLVFIDESAFNMRVVARKGRALRGEPARLTVLPKRKNLTLIGALSRSSLIFHKLVASQGESKRGVTADDFRLFLLDLRPHLPEGTVILLDNASIHTATSVQSTFTLLQKDGFEVLFLPPYSLNPIKYAFSKIKGLVHQATFHNREELCQMIVDSLSSISASDSRGWFTHMICFYQQCSLGLPFQASCTKALPTSNTPFPSSTATMGACNWP